jgi:hypothetical protein
MREYWVGIDKEADDCIVCTTKSQLAKFFNVNVKTIDRWISAGICSKGYIYKRSINKVKNTWSVFVIDGTKLH